MARLFCIVFFFAVYIMTAQVTIVKDSANLKPGIYKNFVELQTNSPSLPLTFKIMRVKASYGIQLGEKNRRYKLAATEKESKTIGPIYGFCDGKTVYIHNGTTGLIHQTGFVKLQNIHYYCFFQETDFSLKSINGHVNNAMYSYALYLPTGEVIELTSNRLKKIMADDPELLAAFKDEEEKYYMLKEYLLKYMQRKKWE